MSDSEHSGSEEEEENLATPGVIDKY